MKPYFAFQWHITDECDQRCKHCYIFSEDNHICLNEMKYEEMEAVVLSCMDMCERLGRTPYFYITGGDPILHKDFWKLCELLKKHNITFGILGNPFHLTDDVCKRLFQCGCRKYQLSLDGMRETHDKFRKPGSFDTTIEKINCIKKAGMYCAVMATVSCANKDEFPDMIDLAVDKNVDVFAFGRYCPTSGQKAEEYHIPPLEYKAFLEKCWTKYEQYKDRHTTFQQWLMAIPEICTHPIRSAGSPAKKSKPFFDYRLSLEVSVMDAQTCLKKLQYVGVLNFATVDQYGKPQIRNISAIHYEQQSMYFFTARGKAFCEELLSDGNVQILGYTKYKEMIRLSAEVEKVSDHEQKKWIDIIFEEQPYLSNVYPDNTREIGIVFCIKNAEIEYFNLGINPIFRESYVIGDADITAKGYYISQNCIGCGNCMKNCPQRCIISGKPYRIIQEHCLHCGNCFEKCPVGAVGRRGTANETE